MTHTWSLIQDYLLLKQNLTPLSVKKKKDCQIWSDRLRSLSFRPLRQTLFSDSWTFPHSALQHLGVPFQPPCSGASLHSFLQKAGILHLLHALALLCSPSSQTGLSWPCPFPAPWALHMVAGPTTLPWLGLEPWVSFISTQAKSNLRQEPKLTVPQSL